MEVRRQMVKAIGGRINFQKIFRRADNFGPFCYNRPPSDALIFCRATTARLRPEGLRRTDVTDRSASSADAPRDCGFEGMAYW